MTPRLPITLCLWTSTKGHFTHRDVYRTTLAHLDRQIPLSAFGQRVTHIKVSPSDEAVAAEIVADLEARGFKVLTTTADWSRGLSHQAQYMADVVKLSKEPAVYGQPYVLWLEDDSTLNSHVVPLDDLLARSCQMLADNHELTSVRLLRPTDLSTSPMVSVPPEQEDSRWFYSPHVNFQPLLLRSRDFYLASRFVEENPQAVASVQCEMLWRMVLAPFSRSPRQHLVYHPSYASTTHLGLPDYPAIKASLNL